MMKKIMITGWIFGLSLVAGVYLLPATAQAVLAPGCTSPILGLPSWYEYLDVGPKNGDDCAIIGPTVPADPTSIDWERAVPRVVMAVIQIMLRLAGLVAIGFTIYGGFRYILSQGEPEATKNAKGTIVGASIGLVIALFAATVVGFVGNILWK